MNFDAIFEEIKTNKIADGAVSDAKIGNIDSPGAILAAMRPDRQVTCQVCGKIFTAKDGRAKFCCNACKQRDKYKRVKSAMKDLEAKVKEAKITVLSKTTTNEQKDEALHFLGTVLDEDEFRQIAIKGGLNNFR
jgi:tRNA(Ile2) C34 agmatinyltransferase TiaS